MVNKKYDNGLIACLILLILCCAGIIGVIVSVIIPKEDSPQPSVQRIMTNSVKTIIERREKDGSISEYRMTKDPIFHGAYPFESTEKLTELPDVSRWKYRITYYLNEDAQIMFLLGEDWLYTEGAAYSFNYIREFVVGIGAVFDYWNSVFATYN